jgi:hypothetical protein
VIRRSAVALVVAGLSAACTSRSPHAQSRASPPVAANRTSTAATPTGSAGWWRPVAGVSWQLQLTGRIDVDVDADVFDVDLFDVPASTVAELHRKGRKVICYFSAGTLEDWRPDAGRFPAALLGRRLPDWPGERWLDIRGLEHVLPVLEARLDLCRRKGFDGADPDNVEAYANDSGFPLTAAQQLRFNRLVADAAHRRGLAVGLKNDVDQVGQLVASFDFAVNEQCFQYDECGRLAPFVAAGKPVLNVEYERSPSALCGQSRHRRFSSIRKRLDLDSWLLRCPRQQ